MEFATGALGTLLPKLGQLLQDEYDLQTGVKNNIKFLVRELESMHAALRTVGEVPREQLRELVRIWARDVREVSYDMEDIVDTFLVRVQGPERPSKRSAKRFIKKMKDVFTKAPTRYEIGQEIKDIKERVEEIAKRRDRYKVDDITPVKTIDVDPRITHLYTKAADLVGIDHSRDELITRLTNKGDDTSVQKQRIVSVVGFGGLGKTTLAKVVFDRLKGQFGCTAFVPIGRNPNLKKVLMDILIDFDKQYRDPIFATLDERQLINESQEFLEKKRYLIVIDDVWETRSWQTIKLAFVENNSGSRIIITTRNQEVAKEAGEVYKLQQLSHDNSQKLFFGRIYGDESKFSDHQPDDEVSDRILKKCEGIPLAIITMASLLVGKPREEWTELHRSIDFGNKENQQVENTMKILSFSYYDLPSHLRTFLLHLSMFPEDYFIEKGPLIWMWIAEGFVQRRQGVSSFEIGEGYFNELVNRSMIQLVDQWDEGNRKLVHGCRVHDMVLDLIRSISCEENFVTILDNNEGASSSSSKGKVRRLVLQNNGTVEAHMDMQPVRSFMLWGFDVDKGRPRLSFKLIRVLVIDTSFQRTEPWHLKHLRNLLHLRYLWLIRNGDVGLPEEGIGTLKFLKTLDVEGHYACDKIVWSVGLLTQLQCLRLRDSLLNWITILPDTIRKLTSLEELQICFPVHALREEEEEALRRFMKALGSLRELRVLRVNCFLPLSAELQIDLLESLHNLKKMKHLSLEASSAAADTAAWETTGFLLPGHLQQLFLEEIIFSRFPSFCINAAGLAILSHLSIHVDSIDEQDLTTIGLLPELCFLNLDLQCQALVPSNGDNHRPADAAGNGDYLFKKLRHFNLDCAEVRLVPSKDGSSGVSFRMRYVRTCVLLGSEWEGVCSGKDLVPTLMPRVQKLSFLVVSVRDFIDENHGGSLCLEYFASLQNIRVRIHKVGVPTADLETVEAALQHAADVHPNRPTLHAERNDLLRRSSWFEMFLSAQDQEVQEASTTEGN